MEKFRLAALAPIGKKISGVLAYHICSRQLDPVRLSPSAGTNCRAVRSSGSTRALLLKRAECLEATKAWEGQAPRWCEGLKPKILEDNSR